LITQRSQTNRDMPASATNQREAKAQHHDHERQLDRQHETGEQRSEILDRHVQVEKFDHVISIRHVG